MQLPVDSGRRWAQCPFVADRLISDHGDVYSKKLGRCLRQTMIGPQNKMYPSVGHYVNGKTKHLKVHRLVALLFVANPNNCPVVNHLDGDKSNSHFTNLEWTTVSGNAFHAVDTGLNPKRGKDNPNSKIDEQKAGEIRALFSSGVSQPKIAARFGLNQSTVSRLLNNKTWRNAS